jgi:hypothetical protein
VLEDVVDGRAWRCDVEVVYDGAAVIEKQLAVKGVQIASDRNQGDEGVDPPPSSHQRRCQVPVDMGLEVA